MLATHTHTRTHVPEWGLASPCSYSAPHSVTWFTHVRTVIFSAFSMHYPQSTTCAVRMCSVPRRRVRDVTRTRAGVMDITLWGMPRGTGSHFCAAPCRPSQWKRSKRWGRWSIVGPYVSYGLFQTTGEMCAKFGSDRFRNVDLYKVQTNIQTFIFIYKILHHKVRQSQTIVTAQNVAWSGH
jgi:hypothetical protein